MIYSGGGRGIRQEVSRAMAGGASGPEAFTPYTSKYIYDHSFWGGFSQDFFSSRPHYAILGNWNSRSNSFVRAPSLGGGSNAPRPAVSVPHLDVNADRR